jgi:hypothetical protein
MSFPRRCDRDYQVILRTPSTVRDCACVFRRLRAESGGGVRRCHRRAQRIHPSDLHPLPRLSSAIWVARPVRSLLDGEIRPDQIMLLGPHRLEHSFLAGRRELAGLPIVSLAEPSDRPSEALRYSTLRRYKGLEADVVLLCDVDGNPTSCSRRHVYVEASRAKHRLYVFAHEGAMERIGWLRA